MEIVIVILLIINKSLKNINNYKYCINKFVDVKLYKIMKTNTNKNVFSINEILEDYQIPDLCFFGEYLSEIFVDLTKKSQRNLISIEKYIFGKYYEIYGIIFDRIFKIFDQDNDGVLNKDEFILGMKILYSQATSLKTLSLFIFNLYDFDQDGKIIKEDVKIILTHVFLSNNDKEFRELFQNINELQTNITKIIDYSFQEKKEMDFNDFCYIIKNNCSDIFIFVLIFLLKKRPFCDETIFVYMSEKNIPPNLLEVSAKYPKLEPKIIASPILNFNLVNDSKHKKKLIFDKLLLQRDENSFDLDIIDNKIKESIIFHEGLIFKFSNNEKNKINKINKLYYRLIGKDLYYYKKSDLKNHKGINNLSCAFVKEGESIVLNKIKYFSIIINYYKTEKIYYFDTIENRNIWLEKLRNAIGQKDIENKYEISQKIIGKGSTCTVIHGINKKNKENVAIKIINKKNLDYKKLELVMNELYILKICQNPYIIKLYDIFENNNNIYIIMEYCKNGNLHYDKNDNKLQENLIKEIVYKLLLAINFIHSLGIIHRDIKITNILFFDESKVNIRLIDFGLGKLLGTNEKTKERCGTLAFAAPELLEGKPYTKSVDFWSLGIVTYYLLCGYLPFKNENSEEIIKQIIESKVSFKENIWENISIEAKNFVGGLLEKNPLKRFNIEQLLEHPWVKNLKKTKEIIE